MKNFTMTSSCLFNSGTTFLQTVTYNNNNVFLPADTKSIVLLRTEIPSGMCAELRTVAASNNRDHPTRSFYYCLFAPHT